MIIEKFMKIGNARKGDVILNYDGSEEKIESIEFMPENEDVYNLEVAGNHNYYANGILVHNKAGAYKGKDDETKAAIKSWLDMWGATQESMGLLNARAEDLIETYNTTSGSTKEAHTATMGAMADQYQQQQKSIEQDFQQQASGLRSDFQQGWGQAQSAIGQSGFASGGTAVQQANTMQEGFSQTGVDLSEGARLERESALTGYEGKREVETASYDLGQATDEAGLEASLYDIALQQSSLYASALGNAPDPSIAEYMPTPDFTQGYEGGTSWSDSSLGNAVAERGAATGGLFGWREWGGECFSHDTQVDGKDIAKIKVGDIVASYNTKTKIIEKAEVVETFKHKNNNGYLVINGRIKATPNHPFYIKRGL